jgi:hypothetical protein
MHQPLRCRSAAKQFTDRLILVGEDEQANGDPRHREGRYKGITTNSTLPLLKSALEKHHGKEQLVVGDFNMHHSRWDGDNYRRSRNTPSTQTDFMIAKMERWGLQALNC